MPAERGGTTQRNAGFEEMSGEAVPQRVRMHVFGIPARLPASLHASQTVFVSIG